MGTTRLHQWTLVTALSFALTACGGDGGLNTGGGGSGGGGVTGSENIELRSLSYTNTGNWLYKVLLQTADDDTADTNGNFARYDLYASNTAGTLNTWTSANTPAQANDLYWNGSNWRNCVVGYRTTLGPVGAGNNRQFNYCDMYATGAETFVETDISGQSMASVIADIRATAGSDGLIDFADYGPSNISDLGFATFPAGSVRRDVITTVDAYAVRYADTNANNLRAYNADLASGGTPASNSACSPAISSTIDDLSTEAFSLEALIAVAGGTPCSYAQATNSLGEMSLSPHEWWGPSTIEFGELPGVDARPVGTANYYSPEPSLRIAFDGELMSVTSSACSAELMAQFVTVPFSGLATMRSKRWVMPG